MLKQLVFCSLVISYSPSLYTMTHDDMQRLIRHNENSEDIALANRAAYAGSLKSLEKIFEENPDYVFNDPAECFSPTSYRELFQTKSPKLIGTPLLFAALSARQPEQKIIFLKEHGQRFDSNNTNPLENPFWMAVDRHEQEESSMTRSIIITFLKYYPETRLSRDAQGDTVLIRAARRADAELVAHILHATNYDAQLIDAPKISLDEIPRRTQTALETAIRTTYTFHHSSLFKEIESFIFENAFNANKKACIALLQDAEARYKKGH